MTLNDVWFFLFILIIAGYLVLDGFDMGRRTQGVGTQIECCGRDGICDRTGDFVPGYGWKAQGRHFQRVEIRTGQGEIARACAQSFQLGAMHEASVELMMAADVIDMGVGGDGGGWAVQDVAGELAKAGDAHAGVDNEIAVAPAHMPDVAAKQGGNVRLPDVRYAIRERAALEPLLSHPERHDLPSTDFMPVAARDAGSPTRRRMHLVHSAYLRRAQIAATASTTAKTSASTTICGTCRTGLSAYSNSAPKR